MNMQNYNSRIEISLFEPRIPQNTGNIARTCAAFNIQLNLIEPLGFEIDDRHLKRAGLDYWPYVRLNSYYSFDHYRESIKGESRIIGCSKYGGIELPMFEFKSTDILLFGREDTGLPLNVRQSCDQIVSIPMPGAADHDGKNGVRSLNLSVAVSIIAYEALASTSAL